MASRRPRFLAKVMSGHKMFIASDEKRGITQFPIARVSGNVARVRSFFRDTGRAGEELGLVSAAKAKFILRCRLSRDRKPATSDYEPVRLGFPGLAAPVERIYPCLAPFWSWRMGEPLLQLTVRMRLNPLRMA